MINYNKILRDMRKAQGVYNGFCDWLDTLSITNEKEAQRAAKVRYLVRGKYETVLMYYNDINNIISKNELNF